VAPVSARRDELAALTTRVTRRTDGTDRASPHYPPIEHVIYIIKENRTYDQVLGESGRGRRHALVFFGGA